MCYFLVTKNIECVIFICYVSHSDGTGFEDLAPVFYIITYFRVYKAMEWVNSDDSRVGSMTGKQVISEIFVLVKLALENVKRKKKCGENWNIFT